MSVGGGGGWLSLQSAETVHRGNNSPYNNFFSEGSAAIHLKYVRIFPGRLDSISKDIFYSTAPNVTPLSPVHSHIELIFWSLTRKLSKSVKTFRSHFRGKPIPCLFEGTASPDIYFHINFYKIKSILSVWPLMGFYFFTSLFPRYLETYFENASMKTLTNSADFP